MDRKLYLKEVNDYCGSNFELNEMDAINWFDDILNKLETRTINNSINYYIDDTVHMQFFLDTKNLFCDYKSIWLILKNEFLMEDSEVDFFIEERVKSILKIKSIRSVIRFKFN